MTPKCRICDSQDLTPILSLGSLPLANSLLTAEKLMSLEPAFPLDLVLCSRCSSLQITETVPPELLFSNYPYFSSFSDTMLHHARTLAEDLTHSLRLGSKELVVEVGSNDGYLLQYFKRLNVPVLGIDPAANIAKVAEAKGIPTVNDFFGSRLAKTLLRQGKQADVIIGANVLAHAAHLHEFVEGIRILLKPTGTAVFEVTYARDTIDRCEFDIIYHEHLCYYSLTALVHLFSLHGLQVVDAEVVRIHGGSLRVYLRPGNRAEPSVRMQTLLEEERKWGVRDPTTYAHFADRVKAKREALLTLLRELKRAGHRLVGYGAAAKGTVLLNVFGIGPELLDYVVDRSPHKQGLYMPGCHLPVYAPERLLEDRPDYALLLAWNFKAEILEQQTAYRQGGGRFIIPIPEIEIVDSGDSDPNLRNPAKTHSRETENRGS